MTTNSMNDLVVHIAAQAEKALLYEVALTPKPGLVDRNNSGAHSDMDFFTFIDSIVSLSPYLLEYVKLGAEHEGSAKELFHKVRSMGVHAEKAMLAATNNINTHKGANFSFAVLLGATGACVRQGKALPFTQKDTQEILAYAKEMSYGLVTNDFSALETKSSLSYGEKLFLTYGITGIRGEAEAGYPALGELVLPYLRANRDRPTELLLLETLLLLMSQVEDGNIIHRGGIDAWHTVKTEAKKLLQASTEGTLKELMYSYDLMLIERHLSPGGAADLLSLGIFFAKLENLF
ncbi:triphosphoribosyl-dephospho-CoA synthase CitG [uncultured Trichococcus sp.]|uniref:triphosphoribosyl-dephospho-CoA synthase CitG n=1 Tax=uncultured Trichococcus sp. TaxID=189665 RepID=UPI002A18A5D4|nr:triphosphoribosyl-dephospho-CoA synthase CitG [uncultured Trichococcus sp.]